MRNISSLNDVDNGSIKGRKRSKKKSNIFETKWRGWRKRVFDFIFIEFHFSWHGKSEHVDGKKNETSLDTAKVKEVDGKEKIEYATSYGSVFYLIDDSRDVTVLEEKRLHENEEINAVVWETVTEADIVDYNAFNGSLREPEMKYDELIKSIPQYPSTSWENADNRTIAIYLRYKFKRVKKLSIFPTLINANLI